MVRGWRFQDETIIMRSQGVTTMKTTKRTALTCFPLLILTLTGCGGTPTPAFDGELPPAGLPGEPIDPQFDGAIFPDDGNQDPGSGIPNGG
ncbi:MAG: hypothetical protein CMJ53_10850 [Planctomycetaceae bacterium]|nr:hypothetical protein [Planctomycetaceae bacterium]